MNPLHVVTGALGYSGKAITHRLLARGIRVRTLTNSPGRPNPFGDQLEIRPLGFRDPAALVEHLRGAEVLFNTYWVRFNHTLFTFDQAVENTRVLFRAAREAGVRRIVHVSIMNPERGQDLAYYRGKLALEEDLKSMGVSHAIVRPGVLFGRGDILINNISWAIRHLPLFGVFGDGMYKIAPMHVDDFADLAVREAFKDGDTCHDGNGPETYTYRGLVEMIARTLGVERRIISAPPWLGYGISRIVNPIVGDFIITWEEIKGLMAGLLASEHPSQGVIKLSEWVRANAGTLGVQYANEVGRRTDRETGHEVEDAAIPSA